MVHRPPTPASHATPTNLFLLPFAAKIVFFFGLRTYLIATSFLFIFLMINKTTKKKQPTTKTASERETFIFHHHQKIHFFLACAGSFVRGRSSEGEHRRGGLCFYISLVKAPPALATVERDALFFILRKADRMSRHNITSIDVLFFAPWLSSNVLALYLLILLIS